MRIVKFDCIDAQQRFHVVRLETPFPSDPAKQKRWCEQVRAAYLEAGIEIMSISRVEEVTVDAEVAPQVSRRAARAIRGYSLRSRAATIFSAATGFAALVMSVIGFDDGFSMASFIRHVHMVEHLL
ncbi:hypothetical protein [Burkholderia vietnamiensis]|uniref:hypothetical protein n=1 Tax=Burkholderia vietnamiensis TaxID=60552 RepID=UPI001CACE6A1|nr:hypothetical protein [Burkholderia vietnamiensis]CAG9228682.1 hypothetical protein BVI1335_70078 [Burkholderia vietnamiensis]HDR9086386.1 hypothetical protein [Burkholderia vietnamiensis]